ncbi:histidine kinase [Lipomyces starkeyi]
MTVVLNAELLFSIVNDTSSLNERAQYSLVGLSPDDAADPTSFVYVLPPTYDKELFREEFMFDTYPGARDALLTNMTGAMIKSQNPLVSNISVGYATADVSFARWAVTVELWTSDVYQPIYRLRNIALASVFSLAAIMCVMTLPIAHFAVRPIVHLRAASEQTTTLSSNYDDCGSYLSRTNSNNPDGDGDGSLHKRRQCERGTDSDLREATFRIPGMVPQKGKPLFSDELTELTTTFNEMTKELRKQYYHLEDRVRERTKELEAAKLQAEAANEAKSVFIANITHELRTPLNGILGMTAVSLEEADPHKIRKSLKVIYKSGELLLHLLTDLLIFSRNQLGKVSLEDKEFKMVDIVSQLEAIFQRQASSVKVDLTIRLFPPWLETMVLWGDANRILQIIINLVSNSLKFTQPNGSIGVRVICLGVADSTAISNLKVKGTVVHVDASVSGDDDSPILNEKNVLQRQRQLSTSTTSDTDNSKDDEKVEFASSLVMSEAPRYSRSMKRQLSTGIAPTDPKSGSTRSSSTILESSLTGQLLLFEFQVEDNGPGISDGLQQRIFEPFVQGDQALSKTYGGAGLGLSICKQLAELMGGTIELVSVEGMGSTFTFRVALRYVKDVALSIAEKQSFSQPSTAEPCTRSATLVNSAVTSGGESLAWLDSSSCLLSKNSASDNNTMLGDDDNLSSTTASSTRPSASSLQVASSDAASVISNDDFAESDAPEPRKIHILVAEDNRVNQQVALRMLNLEKITGVVIATDGYEAIEKLKMSCDSGQYFDIIFMDIQMPNMDGLKATRVIRQELDYRYPIVALTAYADDSNVKECMEAGMNDFLAKPFKRQQLHEILDKYCDQAARQASSS